MPFKKCIKIKIWDHERELLKKEARLRGISMSTLIRLILKDYITREEARDYVDRALRIIVNKRDPNYKGKEK